MEKCPSGPTFPADRRALTEHLARLLQTDGESNAHTKQEDKRCEDTSIKDTGLTLNKGNIEEEPYDLRTEERMQRVASATNTEDQSIRHNDYTKTQGTNSAHDEVTACTACDLLRSLDYLRRHRLLCDVIFQVQSYTFYAHRAIMTSCSEVYREKYLEELCHNKQKLLDVFRVDDVSPNIFQQILDFVYTGKIEFNDNTVIDIMEGACLLKMKVLVRKCKQYLSANGKHVNGSKIEAKMQDRIALKKQSDCIPWKQKANGINKRLETSGLEYETDVDHIKNFRKASDSTLGGGIEPSHQSHNGGENYTKKLMECDDSFLSRGFQQQLCLKKNECPIERNKTMMKDSSGLQQTFSSINSSRSATQSPTESVASCSSSRKYSSSSRSSNEQTFQTDDSSPTKDNYQLNQQKTSNAFSSIKNLISMTLVDEKIKNQYSSKLHQDVNSENLWSNFMRDHLLGTDLSLRYGSTPLFPIPFSIAGQFAQQNKLFNSTLAFPLNKNLHPNNLRLNRNNEKEKFLIESSKHNRDDLSSFSMVEQAKNKKDVKKSSCRITQHTEPKSRNVDSSLVQSNYSLKHEDASKPYSCPLCDAQFNRPANLKTHMRIHSGEKPYKCETCGARFVQVAHLRAHVLIHTGEKPYPCNVCGTSFRHLQTLKSHLRIHTGEKPYSCEKCRVQFRHKSQLRLHLRTKHGVQTNTKKTYKQVPGLRSADISAHIKRAQEAAKSHSHSRSFVSTDYLHLNEEKTSNMQLDSLRMEDDAFHNNSN